MGYRRVPFAVGEWYHCFTRGIDKRTTFESEDDVKRFLQLLYLANDIEAIDRNNFSYASHVDVLQKPRTRSIVSVGAYCAMGNHYHLLLHEIEEGGISKYMQKVGTGYAMYFNEKNNRIGNLFVKPFRSKHIDSDVYLRRVVQYIHLNPAEIFEKGWKRGDVVDTVALKQKLSAYPFSSLPDYLGAKRVERGILDPRAMNMLRSGMPSLGATLEEMSTYYQELHDAF